MKGRGRGGVDGCDVEEGGHDGHCFKFGQNALLMDTPMWLT